MKTYYKVKRKSAIGTVVDFFVDSNGVTYMKFCGDIASANLFEKQLQNSKFTEIDPPLSK